MASETEISSIEVLIEIRNWIRAANFAPVKAHLEVALPDEKSRAAYQMLDGTKTVEQVRAACKMSPNALIALANKCEAMGLMQSNRDKRRVRLFDLNDFGLSVDAISSRAGINQ